MTDRVSIPAWLPPWPARSSEEFVRVSSSHLRGDETWECPAQIAAKARPGTRPERDSQLRLVYAPHESFPLGIVRDAAFAVLSRAVSADDALAQAVANLRNVVPDPMIQAARSGLTGYLAALERLREAGVLPADTVVREFFAFDDAADGSPRVEWTAWGILHVSRDSALREFHLLTWEGAGRTSRSPASLAVCARVAADAVAKSEGQPWGSRWEPAAAQPRGGQDVRVREFGVLDSTDVLLLDMPLAEVLTTFPDRVRESLHVLSGHAFNPGSHCASCSVRWECPGVPRMPGLLGVAGASTWTRALSPADLTAGRVCTWQTHLSRDLGLPRARREATTAMRRGTAIHSWLEHAHARLVACSADDLPLPLDGVGDVAEGLGWAPDDYTALRPFLLQHAEVCPLRRSDAIAVYPEQALTGWDTDVDVVTSTRADLVVEFPEGLVVRETKSVSDVAVAQAASEVFERFPQVAVTLCLLADGLDPVSGAVLHPPRSAVVELEVLSTDGHEVRAYSAADPEIVVQARAVVADAIDHILYTEPSPNPGTWCAWCPVSTWCTARDGQPVDLPDPVAAPSPVALLSYSEAVVVDEADMPF